MNKQPAFWGFERPRTTLLHESTSRTAHSQLRNFVPVVWWGSVVEVQSAIARLYRLGHLDDGDRQKSLKQLDTLNGSWREILPGDHVRELAIRVVDAHELRAADSLQLAAALIWCQERPARRTFVCGDDRLSKAASSAGFSVLQLP
jgi:predicted nucleic acid-binding protein